MHGVASLETWSDNVREHLLAQETATLEFILDQAKLIMGEALEVRKSHETRALAIFSALVPTNLAIYSLLLGVVPIDMSTYFLVSASYAAATLTWVLIYTSLMLLPQLNSGLGTLPSQIVSPSWSSFTFTQQRKLYIITEIESYQERCLDAMNSVEKSARKLDAVMKIALTTPAIFAFSWIVELILS